MSTLKTFTLIAALALAGPVYADVACQGMTPEQAREVAVQARHGGDHRKATECFRAAGDHVEADRSQVRASADTGAASAKKVAMNVETAKLQARHLREAFRR